MTEPPPEGPDFEARLAEAAGEHFDRYAVKIAATARHHPPDPHHHLAFLGVAPDRQGEGIGTALLRGYHAILDYTGTPAYLLATNPRNRALYLREGYQSAGPVYLPDGPPMWPMWRPAAGHGHADVAAVRRAGQRAGVDDPTVVVDDASGLLLFAAKEDDLPADLSRPSSRRLVGWHVHQLGSVAPQPLRSYGPTMFPVACRS